MTSLASSPCSNVHAPCERDENQCAARLATLRGEIDDVDAQLLALLNRRAALSLAVGRLKAGDAGMVFKPLREQEVLDALARHNVGPLPEAHLRSIWNEIFFSSRSLQRDCAMGTGVSPQGGVS